MKSGLQIYAVIIPIGSSCIKFNSNNISSLQRYDIAQNYGSLYEVVQCLSQHNLKISNHRHIQKLRQRK
jgi:hypothetical protein